MKKEIPILFSTAMVQAKKAGRKTKTRRLKGLEQINKNAGYHEYLGMRHVDIGPKKKRVYCAQFRFPPFIYNIPCPYGEPGDLLWVRETFRRYCHVDEMGYTHFDKEIIEFAADNPPAIYLVDGDGAHEFNKDGTEKFVPWRPSIHMPKDIARIWLEVTDVRVERLQDISEEDAIAEGVIKIDYGIETPSGSASVDGGKTFHPFKPQHVYGYSVDSTCAREQSLSTARAAFGNLWQKINGADSWNSNPWVWVVSFKVLSTTGKPESLKTVNV